MKLTGKELNELALTIHEINIEKGFWKKGQTDCDNTRIKLLVVSELFECFEAHRKDKTVDDYELHGVNELFVNYINFPNDFATKANFVRNFELHVKDTIEDEIADTMIRLLDYAAFLKVDFEDLKTEKIISNRYFSGDFIIDIDSLIDSSLFLLDKMRFELDYKNFDAILICYQNIVAFAAAHLIDLQMNVKLKIAYNRTRDKMHGKKY
jgi:NTP pyrophosphatase (non-canonical NTP hydrolase)